MAFISALWLTFAMQILSTKEMNKVKINNLPEYEVAFNENGATVADAQLSWDLQVLPNGTYSILANGKSYNAELIHIDRVAKLMSVKIEGNTYNVAIKEPIDQLLQRMGLNMSATKKVDAIKAPMPGLVLKIMVEEGQEIKKGDPVLILEAMKMENVFKAPADATVKAIKVIERKAVEKGEVLIELA